MNSTITVTTFFLGAQGKWTKSGRARKVATVEAAVAMVEAAELGQGWMVQATSKSRGDVLSTVIATKRTGRASA